MKENANKRVNKKGKSPIWLIIGAIVVGVVGLLLFQPKSTSNNTNNDKDNSNNSYLNTQNYNLASRCAKDAAARYGISNCSSFEQIGNNFSYVYRCGRGVTGANYILIENEGFKAYISDYLVGSGECYGFNDTEDHSSIGDNNKVNIYKEITVDLSKYYTSNLKKILKDHRISIAKDDYKETNNQITIYLFYNDTCSHCINFIKFLNSILNGYGEYFKLVSFNVSDTDSMDLFLNVTETTGNDGHIPFIIIGDYVHVGYSSSDDKEIKSAIIMAYNELNEDK